MQVEKKRGRRPLTEEQKAARDARTPEQKAADKQAGRDRRAAKMAASINPKPASKPKKEAFEPKSSAAPKKPTARDEPQYLDPHLLTNDQREGVFLSQIRAYDLVEAAVKQARVEATAKLAQARDTAKAAYGKNFLEDRALRKRLGQPGGKELLEQIFTTHAFVARTVDINLSRDVMDLFGEDRTPHLDKMFRDGKKAALSGEGPTAPGELNGQSASKWTEGWHAGDAEREKMEQQFKAKQSQPSNFAKHAPKAEVAEPLPLDDILDRAFDQGAETFAAGGKSVPPESLGDGEREAWLEGFNAARDQTPKEKAPINWIEQGRIAFEHNYGNTPPDGIPPNERGNWREGWNKASSAALEAKRTAAKNGGSVARTADPEAGAADAFSAGVSHRANGGGGAAPTDLDPVDQDEFMRGWRTQDQAMLASRASA